MAAVTLTPPISCVRACVRACGRVMCPASDPLPRASILAQDPATLFVVTSLTGYSSRRNQFITQVLLLAGRTPACTRPRLPTYSLRHVSAKSRC
jgi:hypothetical protein